MSESYLRQVIHDAVNYKFREPHKYAFWGSNLPYCPVQEAIVKCQETIKAQPDRVTGFQAQLTMDIGTAIHSILQRSLGAQGKIYGFWECTRCNFLAQPQLGPVNCHCGGGTREAKYKEVSVQHESGFRGKVDALIPFESGLLLVDFKTTTKPKIYPGMPVAHQHRLQVMAYKFLLQQPPFSLPIIGQAVVYLAREDTQHFQAIELVSDELSELEFLRYASQKAGADASLKTGEIAKLTGLCSSPSDSPYCPYVGICFNPERDVRLGEIWQRSSYAPATFKEPRPVSSG